MTMNRSFHRAARRIWIIALALVVMCAATPAARACGLATGGRESGLWQRDKLLGDCRAWRTALADEGVRIGATYIGEMMGDASEGMRRGAIYEGQLSFGLDLNLEKLAGWRGATAHAGAFQLHGHGPSAHLVHNIMDVSNIEAKPSTRLDTLWLQQNLFEDRLSVRVGQIRADDDFLISPTASYLLNGTFAWASTASANMTSGGPAYPLPAPGLRVRLSPMNNLGILAAVFSGNPAGSRCRDDPQVCNSYGTNFSFGSRALWMTELQYTTGNVGRLLPGIYKLGGWYETGSFAMGLHNHSADFEIYAVADSVIWRGLRTSNQELSTFLRLGWSPPDRNLTSLYADGGLAYEGLILKTDKDRIVLGVAYAKTGSDAHKTDPDTATSIDPSHPVWSYECVIELSYVLPLAPWLTIQPDLQYVIHPGGNIPNPYNPAGTIVNALVLGLRTSIAF
jgi:porin